MYSRQELANGFRALGVTPGDTIMLHASVRAVGEVAGGPDQIHLALEDALTDDGTLMMYASCPAYYDEVGRGHLTPEQERELLEKLPAFDARTARAQRDNGALVELFRSYPGSIVNDHVVRFVVRGRHASHLIATQPWDYAFGRGSALERFLDLGGKILLLGCDHDTVTFLHYAEHIVDIPGKRIASYQVPIMVDGARVWREMKEIDTSDSGAHPNWPDRFFARLVDAYLEQTNNRGALVGNAPSHLLDARGLLDFALPVMRDTAMGPSKGVALAAMNTPAPLDVDRAHLMHPLHHPSAHAATRLWVSGSGAVITDSTGREYIDGLSGLWNVHVGHGRQELADAAQKQMATLAFHSSYAGGSNEPAIALAERLSRLAYPSINTFFFTSGGAEASETSFKTARFYWKALGKPEKIKVISRHRAYHGLTLAAMSATGLPAFWPMFEPRTPGFLHIDAPDPYRFVNTRTDVSLGVAAANALEEAILREGPETVAAFIAEPVQGAGGVIIPPADYFARIREICTRYDVLFIADEVITGFGRTGRWFGLEHYGVEPDIMQFAKGITSGYVPLGGVGVSDAVRDVINGVPPGKRWMHAFTYSGHPTCCAVALGNLDIIEREQLVQRSAVAGDRFLERLRTLESMDGVGHVRGQGLIAAVEVVADTSTKSLFPADVGMTQKLTDALLARGLYTRVAMDCICLAPPLVTTDAQLDRIVDTVREAVADVVGVAKKDLTPQLT